MTNDFRGPVRALLYVVQFARDPTDAVDHALEQVVRKRALGAGPEVYLASVRAALASDEELAALIPQPHPEDVVRRFLGLVEQRLAAEACSN
jgi:hypothetical protein